MGIGPVHKERFKKNMLTLGLICAFVAFIWAITVYKMS